MALYQKIGTLRISFLANVSLVLILWLEDFIDFFVCPQDLLACFYFVGSVVV